MAKGSEPWDEEFGSSKLHFHLILIGCPTINAVFFFLSHKQILNKHIGLAVTFRLAEKKKKHSSTYYAKIFSKNKELSSLLKEEKNQ